MSATKLEAAQAVKQLHGFVSPSQIEAMDQGAHGEERQFFFDKIVEFADRIKSMPKTAEQDGKGEDAIIYLHYFIGGMDWYILEKDIEDEQLQAFGLADLGFGAELGYIPITELLENNVELDLYFEPKTLAELKSERTPKPSMF